MCAWLVQARCRHFSNAKYSPDGVMDSSLQTLAPASQSFPLALQFPLLPLTTSSVCCFIFCCNVYKAFLYVFSSKTNVKSAPLPALLDFCACGCKCFTRTRVCVQLIHCCVLCTPAEHPHILTCQLTRIKKPSSLLRKPSTSILSLGRYQLAVDAEGELLSTGGLGQGLPKSHSQGTNHTPCHHRNSSLDG